MSTSTPLKTKNLVSWSRCCQLCVKIALGYQCLLFCAVYEQPTLPSKVETVSNNLKQLSKDAQSVARLLEAQIMKDNLLLYFKRMFHDLSVQEVKQTI